VLSTTASLALYYMGFGFVVFLAWVIAADRLNDDLDAPRRDRFARQARAVALLGILHPALGFAARDVVRQVDVQATDAERGDIARLARVIDAALVVGVAIAIAVVAAHMPQFHDAPGMQGLRSALPFER
jgi:hypothetical protein